MSHKYIVHAMWLCLFLILLSFSALAAQEILTIEAPASPDLWGSIADKVPGLLTLVFLVVMFFKHLDKKNESDLAKAKEYRESMLSVVSEFKDAMDKHSTNIKGLEEKITILSFRTPIEKRDAG